MKIRFTPSPDGKTTVVRIPAGPEVYEPSDQKLYSEAAIETDTLIAVIENFLDNAIPTPKTSRRGA